MVWNRRRAAALAACAWSRVTDGIPHDGADPRLRQERRLEALQDRMDWVGERERELVRGTRIAAGEQQRDRLYVPIDDQRSAVAEGVCADALDLHLPVEPQVADVVVPPSVVEIKRGNAPFGHAGRPPDLVHGRADVEEPGADAREMPVSARDDPA